MFKVGDKVRVTENYLERVEVTGLFPDRGLVRGGTYTVEKVETGGSVRLKGFDFWLAANWLVGAGESELQVGQLVRATRVFESGSKIIREGVVLSVEEDYTYAKSHGNLYRNVYKFEVLEHPVPDEDVAIEFYTVDDPEAKYVGIRHGKAVRGFQLGGWGAPDEFHVNEVTRGSLKWRYVK